MDTNEIGFFSQAENAYKYVETEYNESGRQTYDDNSDILLLILAEMKKTNMILKNMNKI